MVKCIANESHTEKWQVFASLDSMIVEITEAAEERLVWQMQHPVEG